MFMFTFERFFIFVVLFIKQVEIFTRKFFHLIATWIPDFWIYIVLLYEFEKKYVGT